MVAAAVRGVAVAARGGGFDGRRLWSRTEISRGNYTQRRNDAKCQHCIEQRQHAAENARAAARDAPGHPSRRQASPSREHPASRADLEPGMAAGALNTVGKGSDRPRRNFAGALRTDATGHDSPLFIQILLGNVVYRHFV